MVRSNIYVIFQIFEGGEERLVYVHPAEDEIGICFEHCTLFYDMYILSLYPMCCGLDGFGRGEMIYMVSGCVVVFCRKLRDRHNNMMVWTTRTIHTKLSQLHTQDKVR